MKKWIVLLMLLLPAFVLAGSNLDILRSLNGSWEGKLENGDPVTLTFTPISSNAAVMEELRFKDGTSMVSVYHENGPGLMLTHYCAGNNQPRLKSTSITGNELHFEFVDVTNLSEKNPSHLNTVNLKLLDADHLEQQVAFKGAQHSELKVVYTKKK